MYDRELGCKTIGCFTAAILVMGFFGYLLNMAQGLADRQHREGSDGPRPAAVAETDAVPAGLPTPPPLSDNDPAMARLANSLRLTALVKAAKAYAADHGGALPPMQSAAAFKAAIFPKYVATPGMLVAPRTGIAFEPNASLSGKPLRGVKNPSAVVAFYEPLPADGSAGQTRAVVLLDGAFRPAVTPQEWAKLQPASPLPPAPPPQRATGTPRP